MSNSNFEDRLTETLQKAGLILPSTEETVDDFSNSVEIDTELTSGIIFDLDKLRIIKKPVFKSVRESDSFWGDSIAMAAREGKEISPDILKKMQEDRENSESDQSNK